MRQAIDFPTPDDLCEQVSDEFLQLIEEYLQRLSSVLKNPRTRPLPGEDGWVHCVDITLPTIVVEDSESWEYIQRFLAKAKWDAEIVHNRINYVRIRRKEQTHAD